MVSFDTELKTFLDDTRGEVAAKQLLLPHHLHDVLEQRNPRLSVRLLLRRLLNGRRESEGVGEGIVTGGNIINLRSCVLDLWLDHNDHGLPARSRRSDAGGQSTSGDRTAATARPWNEPCL